MDSDVKNENEEAPKRTRVQEFYAGVDVFVTGGTGFLGKILVEKLLRSTEVATVYVLVREKKGRGVHSRIDELLDDPIFNRLKCEKPKYKHRVVGLLGDCELAGLGLSISDRHLLVKNVDVVFHVAATVRFDEKLDLAYAINVNGTRATVALCRQMENLKSFIHVSTAYANCHLREIEEKFYDYPVKYDDVGLLLDKLNDEELEKMTPQILGNWPNTYAFTKALAEALIKDQAKGLPVGVFRPAIVVSTYHEPIPSWVDNVYGPTGICAAAASGLLRTIQCDEEIAANIVPVDTCVAALIAAAWEVGQQKTERIPENVKIYNYVSSVENSVTWGEYIHLNYHYGKYYPFSQRIWCITLKTTTSEKVNLFNKTLYHTLPAFLVDTLTLICGKQPKLLKMYKKIHKFSAVIEYFCMRDWRFTNDNVQGLYESLDQEDKELFMMSMRNVHWLEYFKTYVLGIRKHILKESDDTLDASKNRLHRFEMCNSALKHAFAFLTINYVWNGLYGFLHKAITQEVM